MVLYTAAEKVQEGDRHVRYRCTDSTGIERPLLLNKESETACPEDGTEDLLYRAVVRKIAVAWARNGVAPDRLMVQS